MALHLSFWLGEAGAGPVTCLPAQDALTLQYWRTAGADDARHLMLCDVDPASARDEGEQGWRGEQTLPGDALSPAGAGGLLLNIMDVPASHEDEFNDWYDTEHLPRFAAIEGVLCARRFRSVTSSPRYAAFYHLVSIDVLAGEGWKDAATTPWTARIRTIRHNNARLVFVPA